MYGFNFSDGLTLSNLISAHSNVDHLVRKLYSQPLSGLNLIVPTYDVSRRLMPIDAITC